MKKIIAFTVAMATAVVCFTNCNVQPTVTETLDSIPTIEMVFVEGGTFQMGATPEQGSDIKSDESPVHTVAVSSFYIGKTEVTQDLWLAVMDSNPSFYNKGGNYPVECVSWNDIQVFLTKLNAATGKKYRLPTEAEWEYAARGGKSGGTKYSGSDNLSEVAWYGIFESNDKSRTITSETTMPVAQKSPNSLGIYDMSGNVCEWCQDWYGSYISSSQTNPQGASTGYYRVVRGGSWLSYANNCRVAIRNLNNPDRRYNYCGFRLVLVP